MAYWSVFVNKNGYYVARFYDCGYYYYSHFLAFYLIYLLIFSFFYNVFRDFLVYESAMRRLISCYRLETSYLIPLSFKNMVSLVIIFLTSLILNLEYRSII